jgi:16S rRNA (guanine(966)-N(2))-methyltransferase RsmD
MRIITGEAKGRRLISPRGTKIRPTADRVKESLFNILGPRWEGVRVLDLFSGTGNLGLEAISRGAHEAVFVEQSRAALEALRKNISICGFESKCTVLAMPVSRALARVRERGESFDLILADPPYGKAWIAKTIREILTHKALAPRGILVMEHAPHESPPSDMGELVILNQRVYGDTVVSFLGFTVSDRPEGGGLSPPVGEPTSTNG